MINRSGAVRTIFLHLLGEGGYHTAQEIDHALPDLHFANIYKLLWDMAHNRYLFRRHREDGVYEYGVTMTCLLPQRLPMHNVASAMGLRLEPDNGSANG